jgi:hypothetical protein
MLLLLAGTIFIHKRSVGPCFMNISGNQLIIPVSLTIVNGVKVERSMRLRIFMVPAQDLA